MQQDLRDNTIIVRLMNPSNIDLLRKNKVQAVKSIRYATGLGLKEAKEVMDFMLSKFESNINNSSVLNEPLDLINIAEELGYKNQIYKLQDDAETSSNFALAGLQIDKVPTEEGRERMYVNNRIRDLIKEAARLAIDSDNYQLAKHLLEVIDDY